MAKVSIVIPVYNHAKELPETLESIFSQSFKDFEIIVVNDGSTDHLPKILEHFQNRIRVVNQEHRGAAAARNAGAHLAEGKFLIFWDADIKAAPAMLQKMAEVLDARPEISFVYSSFKFGWKKFWCGPFDPEKLKRLNYITTTSLLRRADFPGFDERLKKFQDWDLWLTLAEQGKVGYWIPEMLFRVKTRKSGMSRWLPSFFYHLPLANRLKRVQEYNYWRSVVLDKHQ